MRMPDLLGTKRGRLAAFFFLYITEGIPLGFTATAVATQMRRQGLGVVEIAAFVGSLYLPWAFKWAVGPFVDLLSSDRFGRRRTWIVLAQTMMILTLLAALPVDFTRDVRLFTALIFVCNIFGATQDVAIDALAVDTLAEEERGLANGLMFAGAYVGMGIGGAGVLFLTPYVGFRNTYYFVAGCIALVTLLVALPLREPKGPPRPPRAGPVLAAAGRDIAAFAREAGRSFFGTRAAFVGLLFAVLPSGAYALNLTLASNLAVELGLGDAAFGALSLWGTIISAVACAAGGWISDRLGRRRMLALYLAATAIPTLLLALALARAGWILPVDPWAAGRPPVAHGLVAVFWTTSLLYAVFRGLMYGTRTALFMDVTNPRLAATQFTAYMALLNLVITYSSNWQGLVLARWGYPLTLVLDAGLGLVSIALLPFMAPRKTPPGAGSAGGVASGAGPGTAPTPEPAGP